MTNNGVRERRQNKKTRPGERTATFANMNVYLNDFLFLQIENVVVFYIYANE